MKAILVDDEPHALRFIELQLKKVSNISIEGAYQSFLPKSNVELIKTVDIAFLDIDMPDTQGIDLATGLLEINPGLLIVFVTAYNDFATEAFALRAFDYLLKPIRLDRLRECCERIEATLLAGDENADHTGGKGLLIRIGGELRFELPDGSIVRPEWRTSKVRELFLFFLHLRERTALRSELIELFWPDTITEKSYSHLYTAIYYIRKGLSPYHEYIALKSTDSGYTLQLSNAVVDLMEWEQKMASSPLACSDHLNRFEEWMELYSGPYFGTYNYIWAEAERYRLEQLYIDYSLQIAQLYEADANDQQAVKWYMSACNVRPDHEEAVFPLLKGLDRLGNAPLLTHYYEQFEKALAELQIESGSPIQAWYDRWKRNSISVPSYPLTER